MEYELQFHVMHPDQRTKNQSRGFVSVLTVETGRQSLLRHRVLSPPPSPDQPCSHRTIQMFKPYPHTCNGTPTHPELDTQKCTQCFRPPGHNSNYRRINSINTPSDYSHTNTPSDIDTNIASITGKTTNVTNILRKKHADTHPVLQTSCQPHRHTQTLLKERDQTERERKS